MWKVDYMSSDDALEDMAHNLWVLLTLQVLQKMICFTAQKNELRL